MKIFKIYFIKVINIILVMSFLSSCMTIVPDNRNEAMVELTKLRRVSVSPSPMVSDIGPVYTVSALSNNGALMVAGQMGIQLGYEYFIILDRRTSQHISGAVYQGTGGITTTTVHTLNVVYTNDENHEGRFMSNASSSMLDGYNFTTRDGRIASWVLFGTTFTLGTIIMLSALAVDYPNWNDPNYASKMREAERKEDRRLIGGGILMGTSLLFTIPLYR
jgi:hypothetical protein